MKLTARIIRTYHVQVDAEYGDTPDDVIERASALEFDADDHDAQTIVLLDKEHA